MKCKDIDRYRKVRIQQICQPNRFYPADTEVQILLQSKMKSYYIHVSPAQRERLKLRMGHSIKKIAKRIALSLDIRATCSS